jgi:hypothetical protein
VPFPAPDPPALMLTHGALLSAVHVQPLEAVTATVPVPPSDGTAWVVGEIE